MRYLLLLETLIFFALRHRYREVACYQSDVGDQMPVYGHTPVSWDTFPRSRYLKPPDDISTETDTRVTSVQFVTSSAARLQLT